MSSEKITGKQVFEVIDKGIEKKDEILAFFKAHEEEIQNLIKRDDQYQSSTRKYNRRSFLMAALENKLSEIGIPELLLKWGSPTILLSRSSNNSALHLAAENTDIQTITLLLKNKFDVNKLNSHIENSLHRIIIKYSEAAQKSNNKKMEDCKKIITLLLKHGIDTEKKNRSQKTPIQCFKYKAEIKSKWNEFEKWFNDTVKECKNSSHTTTTSSEKKKTIITDKEVGEDSDDSTINESTTVTIPAKPLAIQVYDAIQKGIEHEEETLNLLKENETDIKKLIKTTPDILWTAFQMGLDKVCALLKSWNPSENRQLVSVGKTTMFHAPSVTTLQLPKPTHEVTPVSPPTLPPKTFNTGKSSSSLNVWATLPGSAALSLKRPLEESPEDKQPEKKQRTGDIGKLVNKV